ncbi:M20 family metallopeptidase, partial [Achromobacter ruhlandii]|nr:M20 family metallopeptidase [Achromobacter ruhlandii]
MSSTSRTEQLVAGIQSWLQCESPSNFPDGIAAMARIIADYAAAAGLTVELSSLGPATGPLLHATHRAPGPPRPRPPDLAPPDTGHPVPPARDNPVRPQGSRP